MMRDQPGNSLRFRIIQSEARTDFPRYLGARDRVIFRSSLGDVVKEHGNEKHFAVLQCQDQISCKRVVVT